MKKDEVKRLIFAEWDKIPEEERSGSHAAALFAMKMANKYQHAVLWGGGDGAYQTINGWLMNKKTR